VTTPSRGVQSTVIVYVRPSATTWSSRDSIYPSRTHFVTDNHLQLNWILFGRDRLSAFHRSQFGSAIIVLCALAAVCAAQESVSKKYIYSAWRDSWIPLIPYIFGAFAPLIGLLAWKRAQIGGWLLRRPQVTFAVAGSLLIWVIASGVLLHFEWEWNEHFNSLPTAMRFGFLYLTSFPGYAPITPDGQSAVQIAKWISLLLFGGLVGPLLKEGLDTLGKHMSTLSQMEVPKSKPVGGQVLSFNHSVQSEEDASPASDTDAQDPAMIPGAD